MTEEQKELILKELHARLPYGLYIAREVDTIIGKRMKPAKVEEIHADGTILTEGDHIIRLENVKIYLRELTSLGTNEWAKYQELADAIKESTTDCIQTFLDFVYSNHLDSNSLIEQGFGIAINDDNNPY